MAKSGTPNIISTSTSDMFWSKTVEYVEKNILDTVQNSGECNIGLSGGSTPKRLYEMLSKKDLPWDKIKLILIDERHVPEDNTESNAGMIKNALVDKINIPTNNVIFFDTSLSWDLSAQDMNKKIESIVNKQKKIFDLLILGAGEDGHVASIFPDTKVDDKLYAQTSYAVNYPTKDRLTLTYNSLKKTGKGLLLLYGNKKEKVIDMLNRKENVPVVTISGLIPIDVITYLD